MKAAILVIALILAAGTGWAQTQTQAAKQGAVESYKDATKAYQEAALELKRADLRTQKREIIRALFTLNDAQEKTFWPVYDNYEKELVKLNDLRLANIKDYAANYVTLTDAKAVELMSRALEFQEKRLALRKSYMGNLKAVLPGIQVARLMQLENQLDLLIDLQIASEVPLAE